jgi:hypothetical protein
MKHVVSFVLAILVAVTATNARDLTTTDGVTYTNASLIRVEPDGITIKYDGGLTKLHPSKLPQELREKFHFNATQAALYAQQQAAEVRAANARRDAVLAERQLQEAKREADEKRKKEWDEKTRAWTLYCISSDEKGVYARNRDWGGDHYWIPGYKAMPEYWFTVEAVYVGVVKLSSMSSAYKLIPHPIPESRKKKK